MEHAERETADLNERETAKHTERETADHAEWEIAKHTERETADHAEIETAEHAKKLSKSIKETWDKKGRITIEQKKARVKAAVYAYRARKKNAIPADADLDLIKKIYESAPAGYQIDHIIPLSKGGLHHQDNLQYLPISENCRKGAGRIYDQSLAINWRTILYTFDDNLLIK